MSGSELEARHSGPQEACKAQVGWFRRYGAASLLVLAAWAGLGLLGAGWVVVHGVSARDTPTALETAIARTLRHLAVPAASRARINPLAGTPDVWNEGMAHWADHCASCHGNDGRGNTGLGRNLFPKAPDMTLQATQRLSDGELFAIIKNGIRLTGMPAWGNPGSAEDAQTWKLVSFIRHLPTMTAEEMERMKDMNPVSPMERELQQEAEDFLNGGDDPEPAVPAHHPSHSGTSRKELP